MVDVLTKRPISHDEAREAMQRFVNSHFNNPRDTQEHARMSIPANPERDDDLVLSAYIEQQRAKDGQPRTAPFYDERGPRSSAGYGSGDGNWR